MFNLDQEKPLYSVAIQPLKSDEQKRAALKDGCELPNVVALKLE